MFSVIWPLPREGAADSPFKLQRGNLQKFLRQTAGSQGTGTKFGCLQASLPTFPCRVHPQNGSLFGPPITEAGAAAAQLSVWELPAVDESSFPGGQMHLAG